jgi:hypothetical protein
MDLSQVSTDELHTELSARKKAEREAYEAAVKAQYPCPECGGDPRSIETDVVEEFRFAPRDSEGRPMLYAPYEMGTTNGVRHQITVSCVNGHVTTTDKIEWYKKPREGPPLLSR